MCDSMSKQAIKDLLDGKITEDKFITEFNGSCYIPTFRSTIKNIIHIEKEYMIGSHIQEKEET